MPGTAWAFFSDGNCVTGSLDKPFSCFYHQPTMQNKIKLNEVVHQLPTMVVLAWHRIEQGDKLTGGL
jgi:hypothetical protein